MVRLFSVIGVVSLCVLAAGAQADSVNKCKDARGRTVYQSDPCEIGGGRFVKAVTAPPRLNQPASSAVQLASAQPVDPTSSECRLLREDKKRNEEKMRTHPDAWLKADHDWMIKRMATISCQPE